MAQLAEGLKITDADTHYTEPYDLWTSRAPKGYENHVLHMEERDGLATSIVDGNEIGFAPEEVSSHKTVRSFPFSMRWSCGLDWVREDPSIRRLA